MRSPKKLLVHQFLACAQLLGLRSFRVAAVLLAGLLAYDVFWGACSGLLTAAAITRRKRCSVRVAGLPEVFGVLRVLGNRA